jgi:hypothetical protein
LSKTSDKRRGQVLQLIFQYMTTKPILYRMAGKVKELLNWCQHHLVTQVSSVKQTTPLSTSKGGCFSHVHCWRNYRLDGMKLGWSKLMNKSDLVARIRIMYIWLGKACIIFWKISCGNKSANDIFCPTRGGYWLTGPPFGQHACTGNLSYPKGYLTLLQHSSHIGPLQNLFEKVPFWN